MDRPGGHFARNSLRTGSARRARGVRVKNGATRTRALHHFRGIDTIGLTVRLLLTITLLFNGIAIASTSVQPCHANAPQHLLPAITHVLERDDPSLRMAVDPMRAPIGREHDNDVRGVHSDLVSGTEQAHGATQECGGSSCQGMYCTSQCTLPPTVLPAVPRLPLFNLRSSILDTTDLQAVMRPRAPPDRPPAA